MMKVLITAPCHPVLTERLEKAGYQVVHQPNIEEDELFKMIGQLQGLILSTRISITDELLSQAVNLKWIGRLGSGLEHIDLDAASRRGMKVFSSPEGNSGAVGEHALGLLLNLMHHQLKSYLELRGGAWNRASNSGVELTGKTVGIIGFGHTGQAFARVLSGFGVTILAHDKYLNGFGGQEVREASKEQIQRYADVVSLHLPLTEETKHYADTSFFKSLEKKPFFLNTSRGLVHDTSALIDALESGCIAGAGLDVLENENLSLYSPQERKQLDTLLARPNVLITPHIAGYSQESFFKMSQVLADKLGL